MGHPAFVGDEWSTNAGVSPLRRNCAPPVEMTKVGRRYGYAAGRRTDGFIRMGRALVAGGFAEVVAVVLAA